ncbi:hypothetical protein CSOJ01_11445 [Colletotrichum sojae]|uniref:WSC domain-containing protein n=1 Tax=Colletotrichum sojae TaxID=2175907 RepID=A0A8H6IXG2_9PEZI|nr:hypothetical protein CSOJ01_11445 [Colletotrichum sojae]
MRSSEPVLWTTGCVLLAAVHSTLIQQDSILPFRFKNCAAIPDYEFGSIFYSVLNGVSPADCQGSCAEEGSHFAALGHGEDCYCSFAVAGHEMLPILVPLPDTDFSACNLPCRGFEEYACGGRVGGNDVYNIYGVCTTVPGNEETSTTSSTASSTATATSTDSFTTTTTTSSETSSSTPSKESSSTAYGKLVTDVQLDVELPVVERIKHIQFGDHAKHDKHIEHVGYVEHVHRYYLNIGVFNLPVCNEHLDRRNDVEQLQYGCHINHFDQLYFYEFVKYLFDHSRLVNIFDQSHIFDLHYFNSPDSCNVNYFDRSINNKSVAQLPGDPDVNIVDLFELYRRVIWAFLAVFTNLELIFVNREYDILFGRVYQQP